jgi:hypothetical protein
MKTDLIETPDVDPAIPAPPAEAVVQAGPDYMALFHSAIGELAEIDRLLGINDGCPDSSALRRSVSTMPSTLIALKDLLQGMGAGGQTAIRVLRQIASGQRKTREVRLAHACVTFLDTLAPAVVPVPPRDRGKVLRNALAAADELAAALHDVAPAMWGRRDTDQPADESVSRAALLQKSFSLRELGCMRIGLRTHRKEMARFIVDTPLRMRSNGFDPDIEADLITASQLIRELETVLPE